ncbi:uncharacterized protein LOC143535286 isoform X2 [Bidens hawaiensis]|uniref:uncharacterized protein LOC143535286 isoform X2 n=1 Tax=Bidens hawaiensis TaxID=980011 RepID=UPI004049B423
MDCYDDTIRLKIRELYFDIKISKLDPKHPFYKKVKNGEAKDQELDSDYAWFFNSCTEATEREKDTISEDINECVNKYGVEAEDEDDDDAEDEDGVVYIDENNKDPEYLLFLENLTEHGKSYKLKISNNNEEPVFVYYEEGSLDWPGDDPQISNNSGDEAIVSEDIPIEQTAKRKVNEVNGEIEIRTKKQVSRRKKNKDDKSIPQGTTVDSTNKMCVDIKVKREEESFENEEIVTTSDSDVVILDNVENWSEVKNKHLKEKLIKILKVPYSEKEYKELSDYIEQEKPVLQLKPLRKGRSRSFAQAGFTKTVLGYGPRKFQSMLKAAQNDRPKAINLLRMFRFWLEHVPNVDAFQPWNDEDILKVRPRNRRML